MESTTVMMLQGLMKHYQQGFPSAYVLNACCQLYTLMLQDIMALCI